MTKSMLKRLFRSLAFRLVIAVVILYTIYHCVAAFSDRVVTDVITMGSDRLTVSGQAVLVRDETVLTRPGGNHLISYPNENGAKINLSTPLAELYPTYVDSHTREATQITLHALDRQIALAKQLPISDMLATLPSLVTEAKQQILNNNRIITSGGPLSDIQNGAFELLLCLNRIEALTKQSTSSASLLAALQAERQMLLLQAGGSAQSVTAGSLGLAATGYFFHAETVDGYEHIFSRAALDRMTVADFEAMMNTPRRTFGNGETVIGKVVRGFRWSIILPVSADAADQVDVGENYDVRFHRDDCTLTMTLDRIIPSVADAQALLVLSTSSMPRDFTYTRFSEVEMIIERVEGYRVPETALYHENGRDFVYILDGGRVCLRYVEIISRGEGYALAYAPTKAERESQSNDKYHYANYLSLQDIVITEGNRLYDGKYID